MLRVKKDKQQACPNCEQPYDIDLETCPHCHRQPQIDLEGLSDFEELRERFLKKLSKNPDDPETKNDLVQLLYTQGMKLRYDDPVNALKWFKEVLLHDPTHIEAALKTSWLCIRYSEYENVFEVLLPIVDSKDSTSLQKQRAYTNLACAAIWDPKKPNYFAAESYARKGIELDGEGTNKLWENLATALKNQNRLQEAREAFRKALQLNPKSINAIERQASIERHLKIERKQRKKETGTSKFRIKSPREILGGKKGNDFSKI